MAEKRLTFSSPPSRRDPSSRHSMFVQRQNPQDGKLADAVRGREAFFSSLFGGGSVDHLPTKTPNNSVLGSDVRPRSEINFFTPKPPTPAVWKPLFQHSTLLASATPLLATLKRDTHVQTEVEIRKNVGVQTVAARATPSTHTRDVLVQTGEVWDELSAVTDLPQPTNGESRYDSLTSGFHDANATPHANVPRPLNENRNPADEGVGKSENCKQHVQELPQDGKIPEALLNSDCFPVTCEKVRDLSVDLSSNIDIDSKQKAFSDLSNLKSNTDATLNCNQPVKENESDEKISILKENGQQSSDFSSAISDLHNVNKFEGLSDQNPVAQNNQFYLKTSHKQPKFRSSCDIILVRKETVPRPKQDTRPNSSCDYTGSAQTRTQSLRKAANRNNVHSLNMDIYPLDSSTSTSEKGSVSSVLDAFYKDSFIFESCENLDQLEEEIIRNLYTPINDLGDSDSFDLEQNYANQHESLTQDPCVGYFNPSVPMNDVSKKYVIEELTSQGRKICSEDPKESNSSNVPERIPYNSMGKPNLSSIQAKYDSYSIQYSNPIEQHNVLKDKSKINSNCRNMSDSIQQNSGAENAIKCDTYKIDDNPSPSFVLVALDEERSGNVPGMHNGGIKAVKNSLEYKIEERAATPSKIDTAGMLIRGEIIEKLMRGEFVSTTPTDLSTSRGKFSPTHCSSLNIPQDKEMAIDVLPSPCAGLPGNLEVRRSSWSASGSSRLSPFAEKAKQRDVAEELKNVNKDCSEELNSNIVPQNYASINETVLSPSESSPCVVQVTESTYWPLQKNVEAETNVKSELTINLNSPKFTPPLVDVSASEFTKETEISMFPPPPPPPPPPPDVIVTSESLKETEDSIFPPPPSPLPSALASSDQGPSESGDSYVAKQKSQLEMMIRDQKLKLSSPESRNEPQRHPLPSSPKSLMMQELIERFQKRHREEEEAVSDSKQMCDEKTPCSDLVSKFQSACNVWPCDGAENVSGTSASSTDSFDVRSPVSYSEFNASSPRPVWSPSSTENYYGNKVESPHGYSYYKNQNGGPMNGNSHISDPIYTPSGRERESDFINVDVKNIPNFSGTTIVTDEAPPPGAVLVDEKVSVEGSEIHTDKYYAVPVKEVLREKTSTTKFIPAPPKFEGIGPTEDGIPTSLRHSVKKENMSNWYKTMFKSLHKAGQPHYGGYSSDPEFDREEKVIISKSATLSNRKHPEVRSNGTKNHNLGQGYPPAAKSSIETYRAYPRPIEDYEPGYSSIADNEINTGSKRFLPPLNYTKPSYVIKDGYESDTSILRKIDKPDYPSSELQKMWYKEIQRGGDIPRLGLGKSAPERPKEPVVGPPPPPSHVYPRPSYPQQAVSRPQMLPPEYTSYNNEINSADLTNGNYAAQMKQAIHAELQQRISPTSSQQLSPNYKMVPKSPPKSPEMKMLARVLFDFVAETPRELALKKGDMVLIFKQLDKNWYEGELKSRIGIFPVNYVEILPPEHVSPQMKQSHEGLAKALYNFSAQTSVELPLKKGDTVTLIRKVDENWYEGRIKDRKGIFPVSYIQIVQEPSESSKSLLSPKHLGGTSKAIIKEENSPRLSPANYGSPRSISPKTRPNVASQPPKNVSSSPSSRTKKGCSLPEPILYRALYGYYPQNADELELLDGDTVYVVEMCDDGWYVGTSVRTGVFGIFPGNYVEKV